MIMIIQPGFLRHLQRRYTAALLLVLALLAGSGCGGGSSDGGDRKVGQAANIVVTNDASQAHPHGQFQAIDGYLSRSARVLRSTRAGDGVLFAPDGLGRGYYRLYVWWPQAVPGAGEVEVLIHRRGGTDRVTVNQAILGGQWNLLGVYELAPDGGMEIASRGGVPVLADAVRFEYVGDRVPALALASEALPLADQDAAYAAKIEINGGVGPYTWSLSQGQLPAGLTLDSRTGLIAGTPTELGAQRFTIRIQDARERQAEHPYSIRVLPVTGQQSVPTVPALETARKHPQEGAPGCVAPDLSGLIGIIAALPEGEWSRVNLNNYSDVWTPDDLRPLLGLSNPPPSKIIQAWSGYAWDPNRGDLVLFGGGHANYSGNDVYRWHGSTRLWERASLPSEVKQDNLGNWIAVDGPDAAPASAHTYRNNIFLPLIDRLVVFGGAAFNNGGAYMRQATPSTSRPTGPYFFDPSRADPNKVGGTTGSHVQRVSPHPEVVGGNMWANRDIYINLPGSPPLPGTHVNGCAAYAQENSKDVVYLAARPPGGGTGLDLFKYTVNSLASASQDVISKAGIFWNGTDQATACGYDATSKVFFRIGTNSIPFLYWDLNAAGPNNQDVRVTPIDATGEFANLLAANSINLNFCGMDFDPTRRQFALWCGDGRVWMIKAPTPLSPSGWTITKQRTPTLAIPNGNPSTGFLLDTGILGKWKYIYNLDAFIGLQDASQGNLWVYKPVGWDLQNRPNQQPSVSLTSPANGSVSPLGSPIMLIASANDADGCVTRVEFFNGNAKIGESLTAPYSLGWTNPPSGSLTLTAIATDGLGGQTTSTPLAITVMSPPPASPPPASPSPASPSPPASPQPPPLPPSTATSGGNSDGGGGGGCAMSNSAVAIDPLLLLLLIMAACLARRSRKPIGCVILPHRLNR